MAHFSFASLFPIGLLFVLICWTKESSGAAFSLEEEFKQFKENNIQMKEIVKNLETELKSRVIELETEVTELKAKDIEMRDKVNELESKDVQMRDKTTNLEYKVTELEDKIAQQDSLLFDLLQEKNERTAAAAANQSAVAINGLPSSCADLKIIGHTLNGFYSVVGSAMMESVYCDFSKLPTDPDFQKWIGYVDIKSAPVHFYVQRNYDFYTIGTPIPWDVAVVNEGNAINLSTGIFTAPRPGIYFFSFTGLVDFPTTSSPFSVEFGVSLYLNGDEIGKGFVEEPNNDDDSRRLRSPLSTVQSTLNLKSGDQVWVEISTKSNNTFLDDTYNHFTHFTGFMLQEEIVASLL